VDLLKCRAGPGSIEGQSEIYLLGKKKESSAAQRRKKASQKGGFQCHCGPPLRRKKKRFRIYLSEGVTNSAPIGGDDYMKKYTNSCSQNAARQAVIRGLCSGGESAT